MHKCKHKHSGLIHKNTAIYAAIIIAAFGIIEAVSGVLTGSLSLVSDAGHMWTDALILTLAAIASWLKHRPATCKHTYGFGRVEVLVSWLSGIILLVLTIIIAFEAISRWNKPTIIMSKPVIIVASLGLVINIITAYILHQGEKTINTKAAFLHVLSDLFSSVAVLASGIIIYLTNWTNIDIYISLFISAMILIATINLLRESIIILMEGTPSHIDCLKVEQTIKSVTGVTNIHDLHIWTLTSGLIILTAHVVVSDNQAMPEICTSLRDIMKKEFGISHTTFQIETTDQVLPCIGCGCHVG
jgi:cobalt-zinc-cadmium efflux system protein